MVAAGMGLATLALSALILSGCGGSTALSPPFSPSAAPNTQLITSFGTNHDPVTGWTVRVSETNGIHIGPRSASSMVLPGVSVEFASTVHPPDWKAHPGWFVFAETGERVWMFDGEREILMLNATSKDFSISGKPHKHYPVPAEVAARLPDSLRNEIGKK